MDDGRLRRAQALAPFNDSGLDIIRYLLREKIGGHLQIVRTRFAETHEIATAAQAAIQALRCSW